MFLRSLKRCSWYHGPYTYSSRCDLVRGNNFVTKSRRIFCKFCFRWTFDIISCRAREKICTSYLQLNINRNSQRKMVTPQNILFETAPLFCTSATASPVPPPLTAVSLPVWLTSILRWSKNGQHHYLCYICIYVFVGGTLNWWSENCQIKTIP